jgi:hypothetical protein
MPPAQAVADPNGDVPVPGNVTELTVGSTYSFATTVQPPDEICAAANASGTIGNTVPTNITVTYVPIASSSRVIAAPQTSPGIKSPPPTQLHKHGKARLLGPIRPDSSGCSGETAMTRKAHR